MSKERERLEVELSQCFCQLVYSHDVLRRSPEHLQHQLFPL